MKSLIRGEKIKLADYTNETKLRVEVQIESAFEIDLTCFGLNAQKQLQNDAYMVFYNQMASPAREIIMLTTENGRGVFTIDVKQLPSDIQYVVFAATIDGEGQMGRIQHGAIRVYANNKELAFYTFTGADFENEKAIIIAELYYKSLWRMAAVGGGFDGGLAALLTSFGGEVAEGEVASPTPNARIQLEKRLEKEAPKLLDLSKKALITLEKVGLAEHTAKVALCLDISGSMASLYASGKIQALAERILALSTRFDDDGSIDMFLFGQHAHHVDELTIGNFNDFVKGLIRQYPLEGGTYYAKAMAIIREHYFGRRKAGEIVTEHTPVYVMFVTDGDTFDREATVNHMKQSSYEPIFWQFMAIGETKQGGKNVGFFKNLFASDFTFLEELDDLEGRFIDNADFFAVKDPTAISDEALYDLLMTEYPDWVKEAKIKGLLR